MRIDRFVTSGQKGAASELVEGLLRTGENKIRVALLPSDDLKWSPLGPRCGARHFERQRRGGIEARPAAGTPPAGAGIMAQEVTTLHELLGRMAQAARGHERVSLGAILEMVGRRSFGPLLLVAGLLAAAPVIGDIPSVPTITGLFVLLIAGQLVFHRDHFWLPRWMLRRSVTKERLCKALEWLRRPARFVDRLLRPRLGALTRPPAVYAMAVVCGLVALSMPAMEVIPFAANIAGAAFIAFGLALIAHDGLLALLGFIFTGLTIAVGAYALL